MRTLVSFFCLFLAVCTACTFSSEEKKYTVGVSQCTTTDAWRKAMLTDMRIEASGFPGMELQIADADDDNDRQIAQIREFIRQKVDLLIVSPNETDPLTPVVEEACAAGIPVILVDRKIRSDRYTVFIGADNYEIGRSVGLYVNSLVQPESTVLEVWGSTRSSSAGERHAGFVDALATDPNIRLRTITGNWRYETARQAAAALDSLTDIAVVFAHNDQMALGVRAAVEAIDSAAARRIRFVGIDALAGKGLGLEAVSQGKLDASFQYPTGGDVAVKMAAHILAGEPVAKQYALTSALIDKSNVGTLYIQSDRLLDYQQRIERQRGHLKELLSQYYFLENSLVIILLLMGALLVLAYSIFRINRKIQRKNQTLAEANREVERQRAALEKANRHIEKATAKKLQFFTNISHEVKTPLTLILGPLNKMMQEVPPGSSLADDLRIVHKNAGRLKRVIDQLLDFRKVESHKMNLRLVEIDLIPFIAEIRSCFDNLARSKQIDYRFTPPPAPVVIRADADKLEKILTNLLSNAFKFTPDNGCIHIRLEDASDQIVLSVEDNGEGIPPENLSVVFERFFTGDQHFMQGTGIGLHLTREFVRMHHGTIRVESLPGKKTVFTVCLPKGQSPFPTPPPPAVNELTSGVSELDASEVASTLSRRYDYTVLVVEDDEDIRHYLKTQLSRNFRVFTASNGLEALDFLQKETVALVVSDVMMPRMNGFELCRRIKSDLAFSHLPVILLTALSDQHQQLYGLAGGADDYLSKPFAIEVVKLRIIRLLESRARLREALTCELGTPAPADPAAWQETGTVDDLFRKKFIAMIEANYADPEFSIEKGSEQLGLSRVHLYRKVKEISGYAPTDFLRNYRLKRAAALLKQQTATISEVAYATGFASPAYFSKCFKTVYRLTPTEYLETFRASS